MFKGTNIKPFSEKIWLASPTMHGEKLKYNKMTPEQQDKIIEVIRGCFE